MAIHLYMESNIHGLTNQSSLILGQAALELLSWTYFVEDQKQFSAKYFDEKLRAAGYGNYSWRPRYRLLFLGI